MNQSLHLTTYGFVGVLFKVTRKAAIVEFSPYLDEKRKYCAYAYVILPFRYVQQSPTLICNYFHIVDVLVWLFLAFLLVFFVVKGRILPDSARVILASLAIWVSLLRFFPFFIANS